MNITNTNLTGTLPNYNSSFDATGNATQRALAATPDTNTGGPGKEQLSRVSYGLPGIVRSHRAHPPTPAQVKQMVKIIKKEQAKVGIFIDPPEAKTTDTDLWTRVCQGADWLWQRVPAVNLPPVVGATTPDNSPAQEVSEAESEHREAILVAEFNFKPYQTETERQTEASTHQDLLNSLKALFGEKNVRVMRNTGTPFLRNVVAAGPDKMLTSGIPSSDPRYGPLRDSAEAYFDRNGIEYERLEGKHNLANQAFRPDDDLLVLADGNRASIVSPKMKQELTRVFGNPANVIHLELNAERLDSRGQLVCYDLDLAFHAMTNARGEPIALIHKPCIREKASQGRMGRQEVLQVLDRLGFKIIEISEQDQRNLAANSLSMDDGSGKILFSSKAISTRLKEDLEKHHVTPILPVGGKVLGHPAVDDISPYGIHCFTVNLPHPEAKPAPQKKEL